MFSPFHVPRNLTIFIHTSLDISFSPYYKLYVYSSLVCPFFKIFFQICLHKMCFPIRQTFLSFLSILFLVKFSILQSTSIPCFLHHQPCQQHACRCSCQCCQQRPCQGIPGLCHLRRQKIYAHSVEYRFRYCVNRGKTSLSCLLPPALPPFNMDVLCAIHYHFLYIIVHNFISKFAIVAKHLLL